MVPGILEAAARMRAMQSAGAGGEARILFVDDEERVLRALTSIFDKKYTVRSTSNGQEALKMLGEEHFHVLVCDQRMPIMEGIEVLRQAQAISPNTVRVLLTGIADIRAIIRSINESEVYRYLTKPWRNSELTEIVDDAVHVGLSLTEQRAQPAPRPAHALQLHDAHILVLDSESDAYDILRLRHSHIPAAWVKTQNEALEYLGHNDVRVMIIAADHQNRSNVHLINILKTTHPHIVTMAILDYSDSDMLVGMINAARVFRVLFRPVNPDHLDDYIKSALTLAGQYHSRPVLVETQKSAAGTSLSPLGDPKSSILSHRLHSIKNFFGHNQR